MDKWRPLICSFNFIAFLHHSIVWWLLKIIEGKCLLLQHCILSIHTNCTDLPIVLDVLCGKDFLSFFPVLRWMTMVFLFVFLQWTWTALRHEMMGTKMPWIRIKGEDFWETCERLHCLLKVLKLCVFKFCNASNDPDYLVYHVYFIL